jgi:hypothetical protein
MKVVFVVDHKEQGKTELYEFDYNLPSIPRVGDKIHTYVGENYEEYVAGVVTDVTWHIDVDCHSEEHKDGDYSVSIWVDDEDEEV